LEIKIGGQQGLFFGAALPSFIVTPKETKVEICEHSIPVQHQARELAKALAVLFVEKMVGSHDMNSEVNGMAVWQHCLRRSLEYAAWWADRLEPQKVEEEHV